MLWRDFQCCSFAGKLFGSMTDFPHCVLHTAMSEHFVSIQAKSGLFVEVAAGPGLKSGEEGRVTETPGCGETGWVYEADSFFWNRKNKGFQLQRILEIEVNAET